MSTLIEINEAFGIEKDNFDEYILDKDKLDEITVYIKNNNLVIKRGDVVHLSPLSDYRNDYKYIWDGEKIENIESEYEFDDYGYVPNSYICEQDGFSFDYFYDTIVHNRIIWPSKDYRLEIANSLQINKYGNVFGYFTSFSYYRNEYIKIKCYIYNINYIRFKNDDENFLETTETIGTSETG